MYKFRAIQKTEVLKQIDLWSERVWDILANITVNNKEKLKLFLLKDIILRLINKWSKICFKNNNNIWCNLNEYKFSFSVDSLGDFIFDRFYNDLDWNSFKDTYIINNKWELLVHFKKFNFETWEYAIVYHEEEINIDKLLWYIEDVYYNLIMIYFKNYI